MAWERVPNLSYRGDSYHAYGAPAVRSNGFETILEVAYAR